MRLEKEEKNIVDQNLGGGGGGLSRHLWIRHCEQKQNQIFSTKTKQ